MRRASKLCIVGGVGCFLAWSLTNSLSISWVNPTLYSIVQLSPARDCSKSKANYYIVRDIETKSEYPGKPNRKLRVARCRNCPPSRSHFLFYDIKRTGALSVFLRYEIRNLVKVLSYDYFTLCPSLRTPILPNILPCAKPETISGQHHPIHAPYSDFAELPPLCIA